MHEVFISIGSNINPDENIAAALRDLDTLFGPLKRSKTFETEAVGFEGPLFHNLVISFQTNLSPTDIYQRLREIEEYYGRTRDSQKFSSRTLDLDLILFGEEIIKDGYVNVPRDEICRYAFVLEPLAELAPNNRHPINGKTYRELWSEYKSRDTTKEPSSD